MRNELERRRFYAVVPGGVIVTISGYGPLDGEDSMIVFFSRPAKRGSDEARFVMPMKKWIQNDGFEIDELKELERFIDGNFPIMYKLALVPDNDPEESELGEDNDDDCHYDVVWFASLPDNSGMVCEEFRYGFGDDFDMLSLDGKREELRYLAAGLFLRRFGENVFDAVHFRDWHSTAEFRNADSVLYSVTLRGAELMKYIKTSARRALDEHLIILLQSSKNCKKRAFS